MKIIPWYGIPSILESPLRSRAASASQQPHRSTAPALVQAVPARDGHPEAQSVKEESSTVPLKCPWWQDPREIESTIGPDRSYSIANRSDGDGTCLIPLVPFGALPHLPPSAFRAQCPHSH